MHLELLKNDSINAAAPTATHLEKSEKHTQPRYRNADHRKQTLLYQLYPERLNTNAMQRLLMQS